MKQHITPSQAKEISEEQFYSLFKNQHWGSVRRKDYANYHHKKVTIGKCIEVLEEHDRCINITNAVFGVEYDNKFTWEVRLRHLDKLNYEAELIDALWQAVKSIL